MATSGMIADSVDQEEEATTDKNLKTPITDKKVIEAAAIEQINELVALDKNKDTKKWSLLLGQGFNNQWQSATESNNISDENNVFVVSLLGNTTAGKSFVTKMLLENPENGPQTIDESEIESSTTGNINCYKSEITTDLAEKMLVLDYEGEKGSSFPSMLHARRFFAEHVGLSREYAKERRKAVTEYFPKLAYVLSNIVILIGKEELISADYLNRCYEFTLSANTNITNVPYLPVLIIIENKCSLAKKFGVKEVTNEFFRIHHRETGNLEKYFSKIYCIRLPHTDQLQKVKGVGVLDGEAIFKEQIIELRNIIKEAILEDRKRLITHAQWLFLLKRVLDSVSNGEPVSIHSLLSQITDSMDEDNDDQFCAKKFFDYTYKQESIHTAQHFRSCRDFALKVFSRNVAIVLLRRKEILSERVIREICTVKMLSMWEMLDAYRPCEAIYTGSGTSASGNPVYCYQHKGAHPRHRTSEGIKNVSWISSLFGMSSTITWDGDFISRDTEQISEKELEKFITLTIEFLDALRKNPQEKIISFKSCLKEASYNSIPPISGRLICKCCLKRKPRVPLLRITDMYADLFRHVLFPSFTICIVCNSELEKISLSHDSTSSSNVTSKVSDQKTNIGDVTSNDDECVICMGAKKNYALVPCGHKGFCHGCATKMQQECRFCPICRESVESILKIHNV
ncbi:unnamed protein product [Adineta ricciae]|uniref:RING-type domain-containing protein n=1 Tax=Adineta ricciae TaxID=249248 RepID=A0A813UTW0_ADIRI|nr:unnamed protein product [Adineta ricciae]CAF1457071.1 unnamed protein product [Adineta ricciae]